MNNLIYFSFLCVFISIISFVCVAEQSENNSYPHHTERISSVEPALILSVRTNLDTIVLLKGHLIDGGSDYADYGIDVTTDDRILKDENGLTVFFSEGSLHYALPSEAILLVELPISTATTVIGNEAWRGIIPYSQEKWDELKGMRKEDFSKSPPDKEIPVGRAIALVEQAWMKKDGFPPEVMALLRYQAVRRNFGWLIAPLYPTDDQKVYERMAIHYVSDEGQILMETSGLGERIRISELDGYP